MLNEIIATFCPGHMAYAQLSLNSSITEFVPMLMLSSRLKKWFRFMRLLP